MSRRPIILCILDGWGIAPPGPGNAVTSAATPRLDELFARHPHAQLEASGRAVGLPEGVMGNSEVGHLTMGAGYVQPQSLDLINDAVADGTIAENPALLRACAAVRPGGTLHLMGLLSTGGVHADMVHLSALLHVARRQRVPRVALHAFLDGRDMPPRSAAPLLEQVDAPIATVHGRYYAMDRDRRWERTERSWRAIVDADAPRITRAADALARCYEDPECRDELLVPHVVGEGAPVRDGDAIVHFNFRPDRARQLTWAFLQPGFDGFTRRRVPGELTYVTLTEHQLGLDDVLVAFPQPPVRSIAALLAERGLRQLHVAETEKYAHVTYFFNGGVEAAFPGEDRRLVPSPKVATYDLAPEMSARPVADLVVESLAAHTHDLVVVNLANPDMVGHTGVIDAALRAMAVVDEAVGRIVEAALAAGGIAVVTADHGNAEEMLFPDGGMNTQHSMNPVPVLIAGAEAGIRLRDGGLSDVAPTILGLMGADPAELMTGRDLRAEA